LVNEYSPTEDVVLSIFDLKPASWGVTPEKIEKIMNGEEENDDDRDRFVKVLDLIRDGTEMDPIHVALDNTIIDGHHRWCAHCHLYNETGNEKYANIRVRRNV